MTRLKFSYVRLSKTAQRGTVWIDVNNPDDHGEIADVLRRREFSRFLPLDEEHEGEQWVYEPDEDEDDQEE